MKIDYVYGDLHLGQTFLFNIIYSKNFKTKEKYAEALVKEWNSKVKETDTVLLLGDLGYSSWIEKYIPILKGHKILILGNHDHEKIEYYLQFFEEVYNHPIWAHPRIVFSHEPIPVEKGCFNIHGHTHLKSLKSDSHINLCPELWDYKMISWKRVLRFIGNTPKPRKDFLHEWYKDIYISHEDESMRTDLVFKEDGTIDAAKSLPLVELARKKRRDTK